MNNSQSEEFPEMLPEEATILLAFPYVCVGGGGSIQHAAKCLDCKYNYGDSQPRCLLEIDIESQAAIAHHYLKVMENRARNKRTPDQDYQDGWEPR